MRAILTYHSIDDNRSPISISPDQFLTHHRWFAQRKVRVLPLADLLEHPAGEDALAITFDDGFRNTLEPAAALLAEGIPVSFFVVTSHIGGTNAWRGVGDPGIPTSPLLDWNDLERLKARGAAIEAHTRTHPRLTSLSDAAIDEELQGSQADLVARLGAGASHFAYPYGNLDSRVVGRARKYFAHAHTTTFGVLEPGADPMLLPRLDMFYFRKKAGLETWGTTRFSILLRWISTRRRIRRLLTANGR
jgi:peptidoglycan/xylan/chitin deacetylase (PgdA/CDA1 family)